MFARRKSSQTEQANDDKPGRANSAPHGKATPERNSRWQSLAMRSTEIQRKLKVSQPGDRNEQEADQIADRVMGMETSHSNNSKLSVSSTPSIKEQGKFDGGEDGKDKKLQPKKRDAGSNAFRVAPSIVDNTLSTASQPLDSDTRSFMEPRFGHDFGHVRMHTDGEAAQAAQAVDARAFTSGNDIVFGVGEYTPATGEGKQLIAHELAHTLQQQGAPASNTIHREVVDVSDEEDWKDVYMGYLLDDAVLAKAVEYNVEVREGNNSKVGAQVIHQAQNFVGSGLMMPYAGGPDWPQILLQLSIDVATWQRRYVRNKDKSLTTDPTLKVEVDGRLTPETVAAMKLNGLTPTKDEWAKRDRKEHAAIRAEEDFYRQRVAYDPDSAGTVRQAIVDLAASQAGKVYADDRGDGSKYGWERIARYYEQAYAGTKKKGVDQGPDAYFAGQRDANGAPTENKDLWDIKKANIFMHDTDKEKKKQITIKYRADSGQPMSANEKADFLAAKHVWNWSWCAIFAVWAVRAVTGRGLWTSGGPVGLGAKVGNDPTLKRAQRGDLLHIKDSPQNHHVVLAQEVSPDATGSTPVTVVEGNLDAQEIAYSRRWKLSDIDWYYPTVPENAAPAKQPATPPASK